MLLVACYLLEVPKQQQHYHAAQFHQIAGVRIRNKIDVLCVRVSATNSFIQQNNRRLPLAWQPVLMGSP
jgi:hypothetical protein